VAPPIPLAPAWARAYHFASALIDRLQNSSNLTRFPVRINVNHVTEGPPGRYSLCSGLDGLSICKSLGARLTGRRKPAPSRNALHLVVRGALLRDVDGSSVCSPTSSTRRAPFQFRRLRWRRDGAQRRSLIRRPRSGRSTAPPCGAVRRRSLTDISNVSLHPLPRCPYGGRLTCGTKGAPLGAQESGTAPEPVLRLAFPF
jgi:hypothetical protein